MHLNNCEMAPDDIQFLTELAPQSEQRFTDINGPQRHSLFLVKLMRDAGQWTCKVSDMGHLRT